MMVIVAGFAILFFVGSMVWRRQRFLEVAEWHAGQAATYDDDRFWFRQQSNRVRTIGENPIASYHDGLKRKYENAARRPWLVVEPDPPSPAR